MRVLVLGAGVIGTTAAYFLTRDGHDVTVIERQTGAGLETSFANGGIVSAFTAKPWASPSVPKTLLKNLFREDAPYLFRLRPDLQQWAWALKFLSNCRAEPFARGQKVSRRLGAYSYAQLKAVREAEGIEYDARAEGMIELYQDAESLAAADAFARRLPDDGHHPHVLDMKSTIEVEPALEAQRDTYAGSLFFPQEETGDAHKFTKNLAAATVGHGADFRYGETLRRLIRDGRRITGVETDKATYEAEAVVVSLGSFGPQFLRRVGVKMPIYPMKGYSVTVPTAGHNGAPTHGIHDIPRRIVLSRLGDRLRCAGTAELTGYNPAITPGRVNAILRDTMRLFPNAGDPSQAERWMGFRPMTPDCVPIIGKTDLDGLYLDTGHGSTGWTWSCGSGRLIADIVAGREPEIDMAGLEPARF